MFLCFVSLFLCSRTTRARATRQAQNRTKRGCHRRQHHCATAQPPTALRDPCILYPRFRGWRAIEMWRTACAGRHPTPYFARPAAQQQQQNTTAISQSHTVGHAARSPLSAVLIYGGGLFEFVVWLRTHRQREAIREQVLEAADGQAAAPDTQVTSSHVPA